MSEQISSKLVTYAAFLVTLGIVGISIFSVIFPAFIISSTYEFPNDLDPFETSPWTLPIIISSFSLLSLGFLYKNEKLPPQLHSGIKFLLNFEISKKTAIIAGIIILGFYIGFSSSELFLDERNQWPDYFILEDALDIWPSTDHWNVYIKEQNTRYVRMILLDVSQDFFQNIKLLPFIASILVVVFTALITIQISKKRFAGIVSMIILLQSITFTDFDTIAVYENFWVLFYLISLYAIKKRWFLSPIFYILAVFTKAYVAPFFIMTLFTTYRSTIRRKTKIAILLSYILIIAVAAAIIFAGETIYPQVFQLDTPRFLLGFAATAFQFRFDLFILIMLLPVSIGLFIFARNQFKEADSIMFLIFGTILAGPILIMATAFYEILPYRLVPLIVFVAIGIGLFFSKKTSQVS